MARSTRNGVQERGIRSREAILDAAQELMATRGYVGASISAICKESNLPATSIYHHFGSKQQLLAAVMERGARRWFASLPDWDIARSPSDPGEEPAAEDDRLVDAAAALSENPLFLRLFYMLSLDSETDSDAANLVQQVRSSAFSYFEKAITHLLAMDYPAAEAAEAARRLTPFAVALSDGCFFSLQLEPAQSDIHRMYTDLVTALRALAPNVIGTAARQ